MALLDASTAGATIGKIVTDEKFEEADSEGGARIIDDGRTCESAVRRLPGFAQGSGSYSSGIHSIRVKLHRGLVNIGICSRTKRHPVVVYGENTKYTSNPCACGWYTTGGRIHHGEFVGTNLQSSFGGDDPFLLTLNCEERRLSIIFPNGNQHDEMEIDLLRTPFPWRFCVELTRLGGRVSVM